MIDVLFPIAIKILGLLVFLIPIPGLAVVLVPLLRKTIYKVDAGYIILTILAIIALISHTIIAAGIFLKLWQPYLGLFSVYFAAVIFILSSETINQEKRQQ